MVLNGEQSCPITEKLLARSDHTEADTETVSKEREETVATHHETVRDSSLTVAEEDTQRPHKSNCVTTTAEALLSSSNADSTDAHFQHTPHVLEGEHHLSPTSPSEVDHVKEFLAG